MKNFFSLFLTTIRRRFALIVTRLRIWTSPAFIKATVRARVTRFFRNLMDVKPRNKDDYYHIFGWMVSKRLAYLVVLGAGMLSCIYVLKVKNIYFPDQYGDGIRTYKYTSFFLKFAKGNVRIKGKGNYIAYEGQVGKGYATGEGTLYDSDENIVYIGQFEKSKFQGEGVSYYPGGNVEYSGSFANNFYEGEGKYFYTNGTLEYEGSFARGMREGDGVLYSNAGTKIYTGRFSQDEIIYSELLGKSTEEVSEIYTGKRTLYEGDDKFEVELSDINVIYEGSSNSNALDDSIMVESVYVLDDYIMCNGKKMLTIDDLESYFGEPAYEGSSYVTQTEALAISKIRKSTGDLYYDAVDLTEEYVYDDYFTISDYDSQKLVYLYSFSRDNVEYTFVCRDADKKFGFYFINAIDNAE